MSRRPTHQATSGRGAGRAVPHLDGTRRLRNRCIFVAGLFVLIAGAFTWRLVTLQVLEPDRYLAHGVAQRIRTVTLPAGRGAIVDRNGVDLALSVPRSTVVADPRLVEDPARTAPALVGVLDTDYGVLLDRLSSDRSFVYLARHVQLLPRGVNHVPNSALIRAAPFCSAASALARSPTCFTVLACFSASRSTPLSASSER